ncbi:hypothetical protein G3N95_36655 [Paraburkholderia sp. Tr-20389]|uniref:hypothetical protein n=1 Tax=Paraburkholderia sp. Tr-20389 TaxID=2703903 RepID=UPI001981B35A|nr:hypothetical protein [Paraburkholderia sp. Tr-20389]MBN3758489.1 hypothetical protein [Paraburkholderia sp. Tr-20389]
MKHEGKTRMPAKPQTQTPTPTATPHHTPPYPAPNAGPCCDAVDCRTQEENKPESRAEGKHKNLIQINDLQI